VDESWPERLPGGWEAALEGEPEAEERGEEGEDVPRKQRRHEDAIPEHVEQHQQRGVVRVRVEGVGGHHEHAGAPEERKHRGRAEQGAELACAAAQPSSKADRRNHKRLPSKEEENRVGSADHRLRRPEHIVPCIHRHEDSLANSLDGEEEAGAGERAARIGGGKPLVGVGRQACSLHG